VRARRRLASLVAIAASLAAGGCGSRVLVADLDRGEARRCVVALRAAGLDVDLESGDAGAGASVTLRGDSADYRTALQVLDEHNLPRREAQGFTTEPSSLIPSASDERAKYIKGLSGEIERMIESIDGVASADALVSLPERRPLAPAAEEQASASIVVAYVGETSPVGEDEVRSVVVRSVGTAIAPERVSVILKPVVRAGSGRPIVKYERDRPTEYAFLAAVVTLSALEAATVWVMRAKRREAAREARDDG